MVTTPISCQSALAMSTALLLLLSAADKVNSTWIPSVSLQKTTGPRQQHTMHRISGLKHEAIRAFDPINYASDFSDEMKRHTFDSIEHSSDFGEFKRKFDSIEHSSDLNDFRKRASLFDSIGHGSDMDELAKRLSLKSGLSTASKLNKQQSVTASGGTFHPESPKQLYNSKRRFDSISHASDLDDFKRSSNLDSTDDDYAQQSGDELYKLAAGDKRKFDSIDHVSDLESFKRNS